MLDVNNVNFNTLPKSYRKVEEFDFDVFSVEIAIEKERKKEECYFQNKMCVSSQEIRMKKEEGATVDLSAIFLPYLFSAG